MAEYSIERFRPGDFDADEHGDCAYLRRVEQLRSEGWELISLNESGPAATALLSRMPPRPRSFQPLI
jgi:hypothetical protein